MKKIRRAIYILKSKEEKLEREFNSLDAQWEACAALIASQKNEGWDLLATGGLTEGGDGPHRTFAAG